MHRFPVLGCPLFVLAALPSFSCGRATSPDAGTSSHGDKDAASNSSGTASCSKAQIAAAAKSSPCMVNETVATVSVGGVDKVDLLFVIDNSSSMAKAQEKLRA